METDESTNQKVKEGSKHNSKEESDQTLKEEEEI